MTPEERNEWFEKLAYHYAAKLSLKDVVTIMRGEILRLDEELASQTAQTEEALTSLAWLGHGHRVDEIRRMGAESDQ